MRRDWHLLLTMPVPSPSDYFPFDSDAPTTFFRNNISDYIRRECAFLSEWGIRWSYIRSCFHGKSSSWPPVFEWPTDLLRKYSALYYTIMLSHWTSRWLSILTIIWPLSFSNSNHLLGGKNLVVSSASISSIRGWRMGHPRLRWRLPKCVFLSMRYIVEPLFVWVLFETPRWIMASIKDHASLDWNW